MPESPSSSFIPKRGVGRKPASVRKSNFVVLPIISYALFVSAPLASAAVFIYEQHTQNQFNKAVVNLDQAIESFKEDDLKRVNEFNDRLMLTKNLLGSHVSVDRLLRSIEEATAQTVAFKTIDITRLDKSTVSVAGQLATEKFDGALFQRSAYDASEIIKNPLFSDVKLVAAPVDAVVVSSNDAKTVEFKVAFNVASADVLYTPLSQEATDLQTVDTVTATSTQTPEIDGDISDTNI